VPYKKIKHQKHHFLCAFTGKLIISIFLEGVKKVLETVLMDFFPAIAIMFR